MRIMLLRAVQRLWIGDVRLAESSTTTPAFDADRERYAEAAGERVGGVHVVPTEADLADVRVTVAWVSTVLMW